MVTQNASPNLLSRHVPLLTKAGDDLFCFRLIQEDKKNTDQRAEGIESRVGSGSLSNLRRFTSSDSLNLTPASSHAGSFPPSRGRAKPERRRPSPAREVLGFVPLVCVCLLPAASLPEHTGFLLFVCFFCFYPEENQVHLLHSEV